jgi:hypothetical protein
MIYTVSAGIFDKHTPCTGDESLNTLAVQSASTSGLVVGQLIGNGKNLVVAGPFESTLVCLPARLDINVRDNTFSRVGVAVLRDDGKIVPLTFANDSIAYVVRSKAQVCIEVNQSGVFFPILSVPDALLNSAAKCASPCAHGTCVLNSTGTAACLCKCGFSGATCSSGCRDNCNGRGTCNAVTNKCACSPGASKVLYAGDACQRTNCPVDANNNLCSQNGECVIVRGDAQCNCAAGFNGTACESRIVEETSNGKDAGYGLVLPVADKARDGIKVTVPTAAPSKPTKAPTKAPTTKAPSNAPTKAPTKNPTTAAPTPADKPTRPTTTKRPSMFPTTKRPSMFPTTKAPSFPPTKRPSMFPTTKAPSPTKAPATKPPTKKSG